MAKNGLVICILVATLLLDQTNSYPSRMKARKHSKRRVKGPFPSGVHESLF
ncbi:C-type lectin domain family 3 member A [Microtus ochrogaster]|uniref:C-type lectin domain family 3 member A n=1 Tax=Microtus ochrogaster TaxID=79684 RepID=A0A8J6GLX8_MICOH|nr:C-type lectin domain family 3 member A [Microtus ochrogaster]